MRTIWVTGVSAAGKSAVSRRLSTRGHHAVSTDSAAGLCRWVDARGRPVSRPEHPDRDWLVAHRWVWDPGTLDALIGHRRAAGARVLFLCGGADNALDLADRFDLTVLLHLDLDTMLRRLHDPARGNDFGRAGQSQEYLRASFHEWQHHLERHADLIVDATADLDTVAAHLVRAADRHL